MLVMTRNSRVVVCMHLNKLYLLILCQSLSRIVMNGYFIKVELNFACQSNNEPVVVTSAAI